jgi:hypothetical protein
MPSEVTEAAAFSAFLPSTSAPGPHNSLVRILPLSAASGGQPGPPPAPGRRPRPAHAQDGLGGRHASSPLRAAGTPREAGCPDAALSDQSRALPRGAGPACSLARPRRGLRRVTCCDRAACEPAELERWGCPPEPTHRHWSWTQLMRRAFEIDVLACPRCGGRLRLITTVEDPREIREVLAALRRPANRSPPTLPPTSALDRLARSPEAPPPTSVHEWPRTRSEHARQAAPRPAPPSVVDNPVIRAVPGGSKGERGPPVGRCPYRLWGGEVTPARLP